MTSKTRRPPNKTGASSRKRAFTSSKPQRCAGSWQSMTVTTCVSLIPNPERRSTPDANEDFGPELFGGLAGAEVFQRLRFLRRSAMRGAGGETRL